MFTVKAFIFNLFQENTYVVYDDETLHAAIIDPGCSNPEEEATLSDFISRRNLKVQFILNTHCHIDHVLGNYYCKQKYDVPFLMHKLDLPTLYGVKNYSATFGITDYQALEPDGFIEPGSSIILGNCKLQVLFTPGHAPGHVAFYEEREGIIIVGDTLFFESIGRTDLPGGNYETLVSSIHKVLFSLPAAVIVYPGHGPKTSIGYEKMNNPYVSLS